ncbi:MAG: nucleoside monophosphate kinase [Minisyncoccia bacterium]|jgi:adenylate kinase
MDFDTVLVLGPQGSGKGTQGKLLAAKMGFLFWEMGEILREIKAGDTPLAKKLSVMDQGVLLTDELIIEVAKAKLATISADQGVVFDGIPRRMGQAEFLVGFLKGQKRKRPVTIFLELPREETFKRLLLRAQKEGRADDTPEAISERLRAYEEAIGPVTDYLKKETTFIAIDGCPSIEEIEKSIDAALGIAGERHA